MWHVNLCFIASSPFVGSIWSASLRLMCILSRYICPFSISSSLFFLALLKPFAKLHFTFHAANECLRSCERRRSVRLCEGEREGESHLFIHRSAFLFVGNEQPNITGWDSATCKYKIRNAKIPSAVRLTRLAEATRTSFVFVNADYSSRCMCLALFFSVYPTNRKTSEVRRRRSALLFFPASNMHCNVWRGPRYVYLWVWVIHWCRC